MALLQQVAADVINPRFRSLADGEVQEKRPGDLVTVADHEAEVAITTALTHAYPGCLVLGEEAAAADPTLVHRYRTADHAFTVDPVDGTKNFVHGSPDHAVMIAELRGGETVRSWIWLPQHETAYVAERGAGAWRDGARLTRVSPRDPRSPVGRTSRRAWVGRHLGDLPPLELSWVSCGVDYPRLVEGAVDFLCYRKALPWDHAPGALLLREAGGYVGLATGDPYDPVAPTTGLIAAADPATYDMVRSLL